MRLLIIRHADPDYLRDSLTTVGRTEAALLAGYLKDETIDYAYVSPLTITDKVKWSIDDPDEEYFVITVDPDDGNKITIECLKYRETPFKLSAELFGKKVECIIRTSRA